MTKKTPISASVMKRFRFIDLSKHLYVIPLTAFMLLFVCSMALIIFTGGSTVAPTDRKVVKVSVNGRQQAVPTRAKTVGELLERLEIAVNESDIIEPAIESEISSNDFSINVYKARPVVVEDVESGRQITIYSAKPEPREVAKEAGFTVYPEDEIEQAIEPVQPEEMARTGLVAERVLVDKATPTTINLYGNKISLRTQAHTVAEALAERNIELLSDDVIKPALDTPIKDAKQIFIVRTGSEVITVEESIAAPLEVIKDPSQPAGSQVVQEPGKEGKRIATYEIKYENDIEVSRTLLQEVIAEEPQKRVVVEGTKVIISNPSENVALGQRIAAEMGYSDQFGCIYQIFQRESGWNHTAQNSSSGAFGIPQALPASKMGPNYTDPEVQIRWGIGYMVGRYGSPCGANEFWNVNHWY